MTGQPVYYVATEQQFGLRRVVYLTVIDIHPGTNEVQVRDKYSGEERWTVINSTGLKVKWEGEWVSTNTPQGVPGGSLVVNFAFAGLQDNTTGNSWTSPIFPIELPGGHEVSVVCRVGNASGVALEMKLTTQLVDPTGATRAEDVNIQVVMPGNSISTLHWTDPVALDKAGSWEIHAMVESCEDKKSHTWDALLAKAEHAFEIGTPTVSVA